MFVVFALLFLVFTFLFKYTIGQFTIDPQFSDIIPTLEYYTTRLLSGANVYAPIDYGSWVVYPNYLPFQWLPYVFAEYFQFDYRYIALFAFYLALIVMLYVRFRKKNDGIIGLVLKVLLPFILLFSFQQKVPDAFGYSVELLIAGYYLLLGLSFFSNKWWIVSLTVAFCVLSRFSLVFWLPALVVFYFYAKPFKENLKTALGVVFVALVVYIIPFMWNDPEVFLRGINYYADAATGEWMLKAYQTAGEYPAHLGKGIGFAVYFYDFFDGSLEEKVAACRKWHVIFSIFSGLGLALVFIWKRKQYLQPIYLLLSLKLYFLIFYAFIHVPYLYLQLVPLSISLLLIYQSPLFVREKK